jgi:hypothetical protein
MIVCGDFGDDFVTNQDIRLLSEVEVQDYGIYRMLFNDCLWGFWG